MLILTCDQQEKLALSYFLQWGKLGEYKSGQGEAWQPLRDRYGEMWQPAPVEAL